MQRPQIQLGPFEAFAAIVGGLPFIAAAMLVYEPQTTPDEMFTALVSDATFASLVVLLLSSYIVGSVASATTYGYFTTVSKWLKLDYRYLRDGVLEDADRTVESQDEMGPSLTVLVARRLGSPGGPGRLDGRVAAYLLARNKHDALKRADTHLAMHIMSRNLSLGFVLLAIALTINAAISSPPFVSSLLLILVSLVVAFGMIYRSVQYKRWNSRTLLLAFYFAESLHEDEVAAEGVASN